MESVKCMVVGDSDVGKTYLLYTYMTKNYPKEYQTGFFETYSTQVSVDGQSVSLSLRDSAGIDGYEQLRSLCYREVDVIIICFSITDPTSYENAKKKWHPEVKHHRPDVPILLVGTKSDLRDDKAVLQKLKEQNQTTVTQMQGTTMANQIKAVKYLECASMNQEGLDEVFDTAVHAFLGHSTKKPCVVS